ncbi:hypothetical protein TNCV_4570761 [Trichonephila clavipes]|nr:hypothetical protein TNCV_4570761 [Trichonephila clavipes]
MEATSSIQRHQMHWPHLDDDVILQRYCYNINGIQVRVRFQVFTAGHESSRQDASSSAVEARLRDFELVSRL